MGLIQMSDREKVISLSNVTMDYSSTRVLKGIDLDVYRGQIIGYIGPNGAGKSTTVKIMLGLVEGYRGHVEIFGEDIANGGVDYKKRIGYVPENADIYDNLTAFEYVTFMAELYGVENDVAAEKAERLLEEFGLADVIHSRISSFSKGMRQKVLIISSILHDPDILFFDEPLSGVDANSVMIIKDLMAHLAAAGKTIFYSSHIMDVVEKISNRIVLLVDGQIAADGSFAELKEQNKEGSLEDIFNQLTGFHQHEQSAEGITAIVRGSEADG